MLFCLLQVGGIFGHRNLLCLQLRTNTFYLKCYPVLLLYSGPEELYSGPEETMKRKALLICARTVHRHITVEVASMRLAAGDPGLQIHMH